MLWWTMNWTELQKRINVDDPKFIVSGGFLLFFCEHDKVTIFFACSLSSQILKWTWMVNGTLGRYSIVFSWTAIHKFYVIFVYNLLTSRALPNCLSLMKTVYLPRSLRLSIHLRYRVFCSQNLNSRLLCRMFILFNFFRKRRHGETVWCVTCFLYHHLTLYLHIYFLLMIAVSSWLTKDKLRLRNSWIQDPGLCCEVYIYWTSMILLFTFILIQRQLLAWYTLLVSKFI